MQPMRLYKREIKDPELLKEIVEKCDVIRLGMTDEDGMFIVPVNYGYTFTFTDGKPSLTFYIHGAAEGRKARAFASAPGIAFEMDYMHEIIRGDYSCSYSYAYRSIMGNGIIHPLDDIEEKKKGLARLMEHMAPGSEISFSPEALERTCVYRIDVTEFTGKERLPKKGR